MNAAPPSKVLVADDHPVIARLLRRTFETAGYQVSVVTSADEVFEAVERERPQVAVVDANMRPHERFHALRRLAELPVQRRPAIIVLSGDPSAQQRAIELGADAFLAKPWEPEELLSLCSELTRDQARPLNAE